MLKEQETKDEKAHENAFHIFVEFSKNDHRKVEFDTNQVSGRQIKEKAGAPANADLGRRVEGQIVYVPDDQVIEIKNGDHFVVLPAGSIS